jgi:nucleotide-binding universal stress UspA family protein
MLVTSTIGPILTQSFGNKLVLSEADAQLKSDAESSLTSSSFENSLRIIVPVYNPSTQLYLIEMAGLLVKDRGGSILPLAIAQLSTGLTEPEFDQTLSRSRKVLDKATKVSQELDIKHKPLLRIDNDIALAICCAAREQDTNLILMGYQKVNTIKSRLLGNVIEQVFRSSHCAVVVMRLLAQPSTLKRILVPLSDLSPQNLDLIAFAQLLATSNQGMVTCLYICPSATSIPRQQELKGELAEYILKAQPALVSEVNIEIIPNGDHLGIIVNMSQSFDLIFLNALDFQPTPGIIVSDWGTPLLSQINCSLALYSDRSF